VAQLAYWQAEINRDKEKRPEPFTLADFCMFRSRDNDPTGPSPDQCAAMHVLVKDGTIPMFAIPFYPAIETQHLDHPAPNPVALIAEQALLLAPRPSPDGWAGLLIAEQEAAGRVMTFHLPDGSQPVSLVVPPAPEPCPAVWVVEFASLTIPQSPDTPE
jgi:hypothetical protein